MSHIVFSIEDWVKENSELLTSVTLEQIASVPNQAHSALSLLIAALKGADRVYCGWTVEDAEKVRVDIYSHRTDLTINDSYAVIESANNWDASIGYTWDHLESAYMDYVGDLAAANP